MDRALRPRGHDDLVRRRRDAALRVPIGDRLAQLDPTEHVVAGPRDDRRGRQGHFGQNAGQSRPGRWTGLLKIDRPLAHRSTSRIPAAQGQRHTPRAASARDVRGLPEAPVRRGDGAATDVQRGRELTLSRQRRPWRDPIVQAQQADAVRQRFVGGLAGPPSAESRGERTSRDSGVHEARIVELDCIMRANHPIGWVHATPRSSTPHRSRCSTAQDARSRSRAGLGVDPWTVFAEGVSIHTGIGIGWVTNIVGFLVLLLWIPLASAARRRNDRQHPPRGDEHADRALAPAADQRDPPPDRASCWAASSWSRSRRGSTSAHASARVHATVS